MVRMMRPREGFAVHVENPDCAHVGCTPVRRMMGQFMAPVGPHAGEHDELRDCSTFPACAPMGEVKAKIKEEESMEFEIQVRYVGPTNGWRWAVQYEGSEVGFARIAHASKSAAKDAAERFCRDWARTETYTYSVPD